jgi:hypothetical protein
MTASEINSVVTAIGSILDVLREVDPADKAKIYSGVGLRLTYRPARNAVIAEEAYGDHVRRFVSEGQHEPLPNHPPSWQRCCP